MCSENWSRIYARKVLIIYALLDLIAVEHKLSVCSKDIQFPSQSNRLSKKNNQEWSSPRPLRQGWCTIKQSFVWNILATFLVLFADLFYIFDNNFLFFIVNLRLYHSSLHLTLYVWTSPIGLEFSSGLVVKVASKVVFGVG